MQGVGHLGVGYPGVGYPGGRVYPLRYHTPPTTKAGGTQPIGTLSRYLHVDTLNRID